MDPVLVFVIVLLIGIVVGVAAQRMARASWLSRQIAGGRRADVTSALVGIAGAFVGFHLAALIALSAGMGLLFIAAIIGAALVVWGWRELKF
jgi:uncharacterized membrane protein YeaQ/YmgE (transglycosylase-associated protein family)